MSKSIAIIGRPAEPNFVGIKPLSDYQFSDNPRADYARITNASELFGDIDDEFALQQGDADLLGPYKMLSGDVDDDEMGDSFVRRAASKVGSFVKNNRVPILTGVGGAAAGAAITGLAMRNHYQKELAKLRAEESIQKTQFLKSNMGKISLTSRIPFFRVIGGKLNASPIDPGSSFVADMFKQILDRQSLDTPFLQESAIGTYTAPDWVVSVPGIAADRYYSCIIIQLGTNQLNAAPGTVINITATLPTISGSLVISSQPFVLSYEKGYDVRIMLFPWQLVSNKPLPTLGKYSTTNPINVTISGIPAQSAVSVVVPGSLHPWTQGMRNAMVR